jgi:hypothetical protein
MTRQTKSNVVVAKSNVVVVKKNAKTIDIPTIVLKTMHDDIMRDNATSTLTTKKMRVRLRATPSTRAIHVANASWIFTQSQYDVVRSMFDAKYAQRIEQRAKRDAKSKQRVSSNVVANVETTNVETTNVE